MGPPVWAPRSPPFSSGVWVPLGSTCFSLQSPMSLSLFGQKYWDTKCSQWIGMRTVAGGKRSFYQKPPLPPQLCVPLFLPGMRNREQDLVFPLWAISPVLLNTPVPHLPQALGPLLPLQLPPLPSTVLCTSRHTCDHFALQLKALPCVPTTLEENLPSCLAGRAFLPYPERQSDLGEGCRARKSWGEDDLGGTFQREGRVSTNMGEVMKLGVGKVRNLTGPVAWGIRHMYCVPGPVPLLGLQQ